MGSNYRRQFSAGSGEPIITACDEFDTTTPGRKSYISKDPAKLFFNNVCYKGFTIGPFISGNWGFTLSRDGSSIAVFGYMPLDSLGSGARVGPADVARFVWHDRTHYGPYPSTSGVPCKLALGGKSLAYIIGTYDQGALFVDGEPIAPLVDTHNFGFIPVDTYPLSDIYPDNATVRLADGSSDESFQVQGYRYLSAARQSSYGDQTNAGMELYYVAFDSAGRSLVYPDGTISPYVKLTVHPRSRTICDPPFAIVAAYADGKEEVRIGSFTSKKYGKGNTLKVAGYAAAPPLFGCFRFPFSLFNGETRIAKMPGTSVSYAFATEDNQPIAESWVSNNVVYLYYADKTLGPYDKVNLLFSGSRSTFIASMKKRNGKTNSGYALYADRVYGPYPSTPSITIAPHGALAAFDSENESGMFLHRVDANGELPVYGPFNPLMGETLRFLEGDIVTCVTTRWPDTSKYWVVVEGTEYGPYAAFDYANLHYHADKRYFDILCRRDDRLVLERQSF